MLLLLGGVATPIQKRSAKKPESHLCPIRLERHIWTLMLRFGGGINMLGISYGPLVWALKLFEGSEARAPVLEVVCNGARLIAYKDPNLGAHTRGP